MLLYWRLQDPNGRDHLLSTKRAKRIKLVVPGKDGVSMNRPLFCSRLSVQDHFFGIESFSFQIFNQYPKFRGKNKNDRLQLIVQFLTSTLSLCGT